MGVKFYLKLKSLANYVSSKFYWVKVHLFELLKFLLGDMIFPNYYHTGSIFVFQCVNITKCTLYGLVTRSFTTTFIK